MIVDMPYIAKYYVVWIDSNRHYGKETLDWVSHKITSLVTTATDGVVAKDYGHRSRRCNSPFSLCVYKDIPCWGVLKNTMREKKFK